MNCQEVVEKENKLPPPISNFEPPPDILLAAAAACALASSPSACNIAAKGGEVTHKEILGSEHALLEQRS